MSLREFADFRQFAAMCKSTARLDEKTVIITGGNTGIGKETAIDLAKRGARVVICCRNKDKAENALKEIKEQSGTENVVYYLMDLCSLQSVRETAAIILQNEARIDILINNAGIMDVPFTKSADGYELHFATNHLGHFLFTLLLLKRIRESEKARIIIVSSTGHRFGQIDFDNLNGEKSYSSFAFYCHSKLANLLFAKELSERLNGTNVHVYSLVPGFVQTELLRNSKEQGGITYFIFSTIMKYFGKTAVQGAQTTIHCAVDEESGEERGLYYFNCEPVKPSKLAENDEIAKQLWNVSLELVDLKEFNEI